MVSHSVVVFRPSNEADEFDSAGSDRQGIDRRFGRDRPSANSFWRAITVRLRGGKVVF